MCKKLAIFELGIMKSGILLVNRTYYQKLDRLNSQRGPQIIDSVSQYISTIMNGSIKFIEIDNFLLGIFSINLDAKNASILDINDVRSGKKKSYVNVASYCLGDKDCQTKQLHNLLKTLTTNFVEKYKNELVNKKKYVDTAIYEGYREEIDVILHDVPYTPIDRLKYGIF